MELATIDPHSQKEHTEIHKIPKFRVLLIRLVLTEIQAFKILKIYMAIHCFVNFDVFHIGLLSR